MYEEVHYNISIPYVPNVPIWEQSATYSVNMEPSQIIFFHDLLGIKTPHNQLKFENMWRNFFGH